MENSGSLSVRALAAVVLWASVCVFAADAQELKGSVFLPDGKPAAGATVRLYYLHDTSGHGNQKLAETKADEQGRFALTPGVCKPPAIMIASPVLRRALAAHLEGYGAGAAPVAADLHEGYEIYLSEGKDVTCTVLGMRGPVKDALVSVQSMYGWQPRGLLMSSDVAAALPQVLTEFYDQRTDEQGKAVLRGVPAGQVRLSATHKGASSMNPVPVVEGRPCQLRMLPAAKIGGTVKDAATGKPVAGMMVTSGYRGMWAHVSTVTKHDGSFDLGATNPYVLHTGFIVLDPSAVPLYAGAALGFTPENREMLFRGRFVPPVEGQPQAVMQIFDCRLEPGKVLRGKVVDKATGRAVAGVGVLAYTMPTRNRRDARINMPHIALGRLTDEKGEYIFRFTGEQVNVRLGTAPEGLTLTHRDGRDTRRVDLEGEQTTYDMEAGFAAEVSTFVDIKSLDGTPAAGARLVCRTAAITGEMSGRAGPRGSLLLTGTHEGAEVLLYAISGDGKLAAQKTAEVRGGAGRRAITVNLAPAREATITLKDVEGNDLEGNVYVSVVREDGGHRFRIRSYSAAPAARKKEWKINGLLPGVRYVVSGSVTGYRRTWQGRGVDLRIDENEENPALVLKFEKQPERPVVARGGIRRQPMPVRPPGPVVIHKPLTKEDFDKEVASLGEAEWKKQDTVQKHLTWYGLKGGIALADSEKCIVRRFPDLFGFDAFGIHGIAFGPNAVWAGSDIGLLCWDREFNSWSRLPGDGVDLDASVTAVAVDKNGVLHLTVQRDAEAARRFLYNPDTMEWTEVEK